MVAALPVPRIEVWDRDAFARHLYEHGVDVVKCPTAAATISANFADIPVYEVSMAAWHIAIITKDKRVDIKL